MKRRRGWYIMLVDGRDNSVLFGTGLWHPKAKVANNRDRAIAAFKKHRKMTHPAVAGFAVPFQRPTRPMARALRLALYMHLGETTCKHAVNEIVGALKERMQEVWRKYVNDELEFQPQDGE